MKFAKFLGTAFSTEHRGGCFWKWLFGSSLSNFRRLPLMHDMTIFGETLISVSRDYDVTQNQGNETLT